MKALSAAILKRAAIAALVPLFGMGIALSEEHGSSPGMVQYVGSAYAVAVLIAIWDLMVWVLKTSGRAEGLRIPLVLAIATGWWAYGMVTLNFNNMEDPYTGENAQLGGAMLSALPLIPLEGTSRKLVTEWETTGELSPSILTAFAMIHIPIGLASLIIFLGVPLGWIILAVGRARKTNWEELRWKLRWRLW